MRFVGVVHNQSKDLDKTIFSIQGQTECLDEVIVIDDGLESSIQKGPFVYKKSRHFLGPLHHMYTTIHQLKDDDVIVLMRGGDELAHSWVVESLRGIFTQDLAMVAYGGAILHPTYERVLTKKYSAVELIRKEVRMQPCMFNQFTVFYAGLFKKIALKDLLCDGQFFTKAFEMAYMAPLLEMAEERAHFLEEVHYIVRQPVIQSDLREIRLLQTYGPYSPVDNFMKNC